MAELREELKPRSYPMAMLLPFFPEPNGSREFSTSVGDLDVRIYLEDEGDTLATPGDRKIIAILSAAIARQIRNGINDPVIDIQVNELLDALVGPELIPGGEEYARLQEKLNRLMNTVIETSKAMPNGMRRNQRFRWIGAYEYDSTEKAITGNTKSVRISLTKQAFSLITEVAGFDTPADIYRSISLSPTSTWRIYEICIATLLRNDREATTISMAELHHRIPMQCPLKVFKSRALRKAFEVISSDPEMSKRLSLTLLKKNPDGSMEEVEFSKRAKTDEVYIGITPGDLSDIKTDRLLEVDGAEHEVLDM